MDNEKTVQENVTEEAVAEKEPKKKGGLTESKLEVFIAIMLGITAVFSAWASWVGSLHGGNQATNYATSNNLSAMGNATWNEASQNLMQDMLLWNDISDLQLEIMYADSIGDTDTVELASYKLYYKCYDNLTDEMAASLGFDFDEAGESEPVDYILSWIDTDTATENPFTEEFVSAYYDEASAQLAESEEVLATGQMDNKYGDRFNLVTVIYSIVLFLLGIVGIFKGLPNRKLVTIVACIAFVIATIYMLTIPLPFF